MKHTTEGNTHIFRFDTCPVPASRPRVGRWSTYYGKRYTAFRTAFALEVADFRKGFRPLLDDRLRVSVVLNVLKPKTSKLSNPRGDIDNYLKSLFDGCNGLVWRDDVQIVELGRVVKQFSDTPAKGGMIMVVEILG